jgi:hypothetical protein
MDAIKWIVEHKEEILQIVAYVIAVASLIVRLTPTLKDDNFFLPFLKWIAKYLALNTPTPEKRPETK